MQKRDSICVSNSVFSCFVINITHILRDDSKSVNAFLDGPLI